MDLGRVELSAKSHDVSNRFDGKPTVGLAIFQLADANALGNGTTWSRPRWRNFPAIFPPA